ncbi:ATP-grasp domain-containing protein, partial [Brachybacterium sp.]|uniref:ATP-grasp domain-containing protein n=1 Tax=Brachybacterium sp. TaxID=1891286 RepID=UPI003F988442
MSSLGLVVTDPARFPAADTMLDARPLLRALHARGAEARAVDWADPEVDWADFDLVVLRSPWDYSLRPAEFDAWLDRAGAATKILNEPALVRWNMDKHYLAELEQAGIPGVPTTFHAEEASLIAALSAAHSGPGGGHVVLKPTVGAGAQLAGLLRPGDPAALALGREIFAEQRTVMLQPEVPELSAGHEKALYLVDGHLTHAISKGALLARGGGLRGGVSLCFESSREGGRLGSRDGFWGLVVGAVAEHRE